MKTKKRNKHALTLDVQLDYLFRKSINLRSRVITISGEIEDGLFSRVDAGLSELESRSDRPVTLRINSVGGNVYEALAVVGRLKRSRCKIITEGYGAVMSAASLILAAGATRRISRTAWFMVHEMSYSIGGKHSQVKEYVLQADREEKEWVRWMAKLTGQKEEFWAKHHAKDTYFTADELLKLGVADIVI